MDSIYDLANYYCYHYDMTYKKLQNILYYTYAWSMALSENQKPLFKADFKASTHGPRDFRLKYLNKQFGFQYIEINTDPKIKLTEDELNLINQIETVYIKPFNGLKLDTLTRNETPWKNGKNRSDKSITNTDMIDYYNQITENTAD